MFIINCHQITLTVKQHTSSLRWPMCSCVVVSCSVVQLNLVLSRSTSCFASPNWRWTHNDHNTNNLTFFCIKMLWEIKLDHQVSNTDLFTETSQEIVDPMISAQLPPNSSGALMHNRW